MTSYGDPLEADLLPDALAEALARVIAQKDREWQIQLDAMSAESRATIAELKATIAELSGIARASFEDHSTRISAAVANVKDGAPGRDGRDAEPVDMAHIESVIVAKVDERVEAKVATIPVPKNGIDGRDGVDGTNGESVPVEVVEKMVAGQVAAAFATLPVPRDGHSPSIEELRPAIDAAVKRGFEAMPPLRNGEDGAPGRDGKDADPVTREQIAEVIKSTPELFDEAVGRYLAENPPRDGRDGTDGERGDIGPAGKDAKPITKDQIVEAVLSCGEAMREAVVKHLTENPPPAGRDGADGTSGDPGRDGRDAEPVDYDSVHKFIVDRMAEFPVPKDGLNGINGKDGIGLTGGLIDRSGSLVLTLSDGTIRDLGCVVGKDADQALIAGLIRDETAKLPLPRDGRDGIDGKDGLGFDDMLPPEYDGKQTLTFRFSRGEKTTEYQIKLDIPYDAGIYREGEAYPKSALTTFGGRSWIAQCDTTEKPDMTNKDWRLWSNKGRDGKDGVMRQLGPPGPVKLGS